MHDLDLVWGGRLTSDDEVRRVQSHIERIESNAPRIRVFGRDELPKVVIDGRVLLSQCHALRHHVLRVSPETLRGPGKMRDDEHGGVGVGIEKRRLAVPHVSVHSVQCSPGTRAIRDPGEDEGSLTAKLQSVSARMRWSPSLHGSQRTSRGPTRSRIPRCKRHPSSGSCLWSG